MNSDFNLFKLSSSKKQAQTVSATTRPTCLLFFTLTHSEEALVKTISVPLS